MKKGLKSFKHFIASFSDTKKPFLFCSAKPVYIKCFKGIYCFSLKKKKELAPVLFHISVSTQKNQKVPLKARLLFKQAGKTNKRHHKVYQLSCFIVVQKALKNKLLLSFTELTCAIYSREKKRDCEVLCSR